MALQAWLTWFAGPAPRLAALAEPGPGSNPHVTAAAVALAWITMGVSLSMLTSRTITPGRAIAIICYAGLALLYINVMRERTYYGDFDNYFSAALNLREGTPLPQRYLYPPLWASVLAPLTTLGEEWTLTFAWTLNLVSTVLCFVLLPRVLERYGFSRPLAVAVTVIVGVVNVPILRTLGYAQINMHVLAAILLTLDWYPRHRFASAMALAIAVNLKISPIVLALPFLLGRRRSVAGDVRGVDRRYRGAPGRWPTVSGRITTSSTTSATSNRRTDWRSVTPRSIHSSAPRAGRSERTWIS